MARPTLSRSILWPYHRWGCGMVGDQASQMTVFNGSLGPTAIKLVPEHKMWHVVKGCMSQVSRGGLCCIDLAPHHATHHQHTAVQVRWC